MMLCLCAFVYINVAIYYSFLVYLRNIYLNVECGIMHSLRRQTSDEGKVDEKALSMCLQSTNAIGISSFHFGSHFSLWIQHFEEKNEQSKNVMLDINIANMYTFGRLEASK